MRMRMRKIVDVWTEIFLYAIWVFFLFVFGKIQCTLGFRGQLKTHPKNVHINAIVRFGSFLFFPFFFVIPIFIYIDSSSFVPNKIFSMFVSTKVRRDIVLWLFLSLNWNDKQQQTNGVNDEVERRKKNYDIFHIFFGSKMLVDISSALDHQNCCTRSFLQKWRYLFF